MLEQDYVGPYFENVSAQREHTQARRGSRITVKRNPYSHAFVRLAVAHTDRVVVLVDVMAYASIYGRRYASYPR